VRENIFITGFSGSGKTTTGRKTAELLGWRFVDTDDEIVRAAGMPIEDIFARDGESGFRELEHRTLAKVAQGSRQVVSTGGGIIMGAANRHTMESNGLVVLLEASPERILERLELQQEIEADDVAVRPMLADDESLDRVRSLKALRQENYNRATWIVNTDDLTPIQAAREAIRGWNMANDNTSKAIPKEADLAAEVHTSSGDYPLWVGWDILDELGARVRRLLDPPVAYIVSDEGVRGQARRAQRAMEAVDIPTHLFFIPPGERSKTLAMAEHIYTWLAGHKAERGHLIVAVGGGVVGDLAGFVAATYLRGMPLAQAPTSLLAMMDAAVGGKTAVDLPQGKNLVGAFYQPKFVLADVSSLQSLPSRELTSGWAEAIKHGLIMDEGLLSTFESQREPIMALEPEIATDVIRRSVAIKANVVSQDERETLGVRILLNYGHTIAHGIEAATGYGTYLHGEAVSIGMMGAAHIGESMGMMSAGEVARQRSILGAYGLPLDCRGIEVEAIEEAMRSDKKTAAGTIRWVLLDGIGNAATRNDVPAELVHETVRMLTA
jgi:3-dehydroquinate synthase|tara:strand:+ start:11450 stop:13102 length:1653 start_codon:yes stop_codon:yes gene_type:complete